MQNQDPNQDQNQTTNDNPKPKSKSRRLARRYAMQALYQWEISRTEVDVLIAQFMEEQGISRADASYFSEILSGTIAQREQIDNTLQPLLDRKISELNPVEFAILRLALFEFMFRLDVPYRVVINEAIELAKEYGATDGYKYINAVLNNAAKSLREVEVQQRMR